MYLYLFQSVSYVYIANNDESVLQIVGNDIDYFRVCVGRIEMTNYGRSVYFRIDSYHRLSHGVFFLHPIIDVFAFNSIKCNCFIPDSTV